jgi:hypothetical protein
VILADQAAAEIFCFSRSDEAFTRLTPTEKPEQHFAHPPERRHVAGFRSEQGCKSERVADSI